MSSEEANVNKRPKRTLSSVLIEPFKQIKLGLYVMAVSVAFLILASCLFVMAFTEQYQHVMDIFKIVDPEQKWELVTNRVFYMNAVKLAVLFVAYIAILFTVVFKMTHRYYGPLVSIERFVSQMSEGDYSRRVIIRRGDELQRLVSLLNTMAARLERRHPDALAKARRETDHEAADKAS